MTAEALAVLGEALREIPESGDIPLLPAPKDPSACVSHRLVRDRWNKAVARRSGTLAAAAGTP